MDAKAFRRDLIEELKIRLRPVSSILGAWEGGSVATGYSDDLSDLDLYILVTDGGEDLAFGIVEEYLSRAFGIADTYSPPAAPRSPSQPAPGRNWSQRFYRLSESPPLFYCDICVLPVSGESGEFLERERNGDDPDIWFDKTGMIAPRAADMDEIRRKGETAYRSLARGIWVLTTELRKQVIRGSFLEAYPLYAHLVMKTLVGLLNLKERPARFDFGMRYISREYPPRVAGLVESYLSGLTMETLSRRAEGLIVLVEELVKEVGEGFGDESSTD